MAQNWHELKKLTVEHITQHKAKPLKKIYKCDYKRHREQKTCTDFVHTHRVYSGLCHYMPLHCTVFYSWCCRTHIRLRDRQFNLKTKFNWMKEKKRMRQRALVAIKTIRKFIFFDLNEKKIVPAKLITIRSINMLTHMNVVPSIRCEYECIMKTA